MSLADSAFAHLHNCTIIHFRFPNYDPALQYPPKRATVQHLKDQSWYKPTRPIALGLPVPQWRHTTTRSFALEEPSGSSKDERNRSCLVKTSVRDRRRGETHRVEAEPWQRARRSLKPDGKATVQIAQRAIRPERRVRGRAGRRYAVMVRASRRRMRRKLIALTRL